MTKTLFKKQMMELFSFFWQDKKKNKNRTGIQLVLSVSMYLVLFGIVSVMFYFLAATLCEPLVMAKMDWLYFALTGVLGVVLGAFGSVFNTFASLYSAKDNSLLLVMPIRPSKILTSRLLGVYAMGLMYELLVMIPVLLKYYMVAEPGFFVVLCTLLVTWLLSVFVLTLSAVLGWGVALISAKTKHKSIIAVVLSLVFIAAYYYLYMKAAGMLREIISNPQMAGEALNGKLSPLYHIGMAADGNGKSLLLFAGMVLLLFAVVYGVLAKSYRKILITNKGETKAQYKEKFTSAGSIESALLKKEFRRFLGSPNYMLNCGLGIIFMVIAAVALVVKADTVTGFVTLFFVGYEDLIPLVAAGALGMVAAMNDMTAPSVSLEGKNLWILQVFPVTGVQALMAKIKMQLILTYVPAAILLLGMEIVLKRPIVEFVLIALATVGFILFMALFGLTMNLKFPNLTWTSEIIPIKQSMGVTITLFGGWAVIVALAAGYYLLQNVMSPIVYLACVAAVLLIAAMGLLYWIRTKGAQIFETL
ncbi:MAG: hypothetical protein MR224_01370 [Dorea sp.]|nr:hypothetical protein [Dorea sp.]